jgi:nucleoside-diphosphate-sugar epimerase
MMLAGRSVLVTGGTGFIGGRLVEKLIREQHARVRVLVRDFRHAARIARFPVEMVAGSVTDASVVRRATQGCDIVFHCAYDFAGGKNRQQAAGVQGTRNVSEAVLQTGTSRMIHVSSFAVYAPTPDGDLLESCPWPRSTNVYASIKRQAERLVLALHRQRGLPVVIVQPALVYGPFSEQWTVGLVRRLKTGLVPLINGGSGYCNAVYIDDVVDALILASTKPNVLGETFLISGEKPVTWREFFHAFEVALNTSATIDLSETELGELARQRQRRGTLLRQLQDLARQPAIRSQLTQLPVARRLAATVATFLSKRQWESVKARLLGDSRLPGEHGRGGSRSIHVPGDALLALYRSRTRVRIDKAQKHLGYIPQFDFARGIDLTTRFIHWANLG